MTAWTQFHPTQPLTAPDGRTIDIDLEMVPLVQQLWRLGYVTNLACQDAGEAIREGGTRAPEAERPKAAALNQRRAWLIVQADQAPRLLEALQTLRSGGGWDMHRVTKGQNPDAWISITFPSEQIKNAAEELRSLHL